MSEEAEAKAFDEWCPWGKLTQVRTGAKAAWAQLYPEIAVRDSIIKAHLVELHRMDVLIEKALGWVRSLPHDAESMCYVKHNLKLALNRTELHSDQPTAELQRIEEQITQCHEALLVAKEHGRQQVAVVTKALQRKDEALEMEKHLRKLAVVELEELRPLVAELQRRAEQIKSMQKNMQRNYEQKDDAIQTLHTQKLEAETKLQKMMDQIKRLLRVVE